MSTRPETIYILEEQRQTFPPPSSPLHQPQPNPSLYEKFSYQTYGNIKYQPQYHRMFGESVFLVKCCGFNWQLSHSHANNQPTEKLCPDPATDCACGKVISTEKKLCSRQKFSIKLFPQ